MGLIPSVLIQQHECRAGELWFEHEAPCAALLICSAIFELLHNMFKTVFFTNLFWGLILQS